MQPILRPMSSPHDLVQLMGWGGRGPNVLESSLEIIWNNSDPSSNVPGLYTIAISLNNNLFTLHLGMTSDVRRILDSENCIPEGLCQIFGYKFVRNRDRCCSNCDLA